MPPVVEVIVPFAGECSHRLAALDWVIGRYRERCPEWKVTVATPEFGGVWRNPDGLINPDKPCKPWVKADAVNPVIEASIADVIVVSDGDVWTDGVGEGVGAVLSGRSAWAVPQWRNHRFTPEYTRRVLEGADPADHTPGSLEERPRHAIPGGGLVVLARTVALDVRLDPRFEGWGGEDVSWGKALHTLHGRPWRGASPLWHLWHPPQHRPSRTVLPPANDALRRRYHSTHGHQVAMRALLDETQTQGS